MKIIIILSLCILLNACQTSKFDLGIANDYFPNNKFLKEGIVNKYYVHQKKHDSPDISTHIEYESYQIKNNKLVCQRYNPAYNLIKTKEFSFKDNQMILLNETQYWRKDTFVAHINKPVEKDWAAQSSNSEKVIYYYNGSKSEIQSQQERNVDTVFLNKPSKQLEGKVSEIVYDGTDTFKTNQHFKNIYTKNLGLSYGESSDSIEINWMELVEQMPLKMFNRLARHGLQRVAYINPDKKLDKDNAFEICKENSHIYDYYYGREVIRYKGGKKALWSIVNQHLKSENLFNESGYLTFRFVVNCKGEKGRIITEEADLNYKRKTFNTATTSHFYNILKEMKDWTPPKRRDKNINAYFYLTFKLKDGELIELLP